MQVVNHFEMPTARSQVVGGLPDAPTGWTRPRMSNAQRTAAARAARAARDQNRPVGEDHAGAPVPQGIIPEGGDEINHDAGLLGFERVLLHLQLALLSLLLVQANTAHAVHQLLLHRLVFSIVHRQV